MGKRRRANWDQPFEFSGAVGQIRRRREPPAPPRTPDPAVSFNLGGLVIKWNERAAELEKAVDVLDAALKASTGRMTDLAGQLTRALPPTPSVEFDPELDRAWDGRYLGVAPYYHVMELSELRGRAGFYYRGFEADGLQEEPPTD